MIGLILGIADLVLTVFTVLSDGSQVIQILTISLTTLSLPFSIRVLFSLYLCTFLSHSSFVYSFLHSFIYLCIYSFVLIFVYFFIHMINFFPHYFSLNFGYILIYLFNSVFLFSYFSILLPASYLLSFYKILIYFLQNLYKYHLNSHVREICDQFLFVFHLFYNLIPTNLCLDRHWI